MGKTDWTRLQNMSEAEIMQNALDDPDAQPTSVAMWNNAKEVIGNEIVVKAGTMDCDIYKSVFSGEVVFAVETDSGHYEGIAPKHYALSDTEFSEIAHKGLLRVHVISNGGDKAKVATPDGVVLSVPATIVHYK